MDSQDTTFNYKITVAALVAVILGILIAFYYSYAQSQNRLLSLEQEKKLLVQDLTLARAEMDQLSSLNEFNEIELRDSKFQIQNLLDSVGQLNFDLGKLRQTSKKLKRLEVRFDSLLFKNKLLKNNSNLLTSRYETVLQELEDLKGTASSLQESESLLREDNTKLTEELKIKSYLSLEDSEGSGFRFKASKPIRTNKASIVERLRGCVTVAGNPNEEGDIKVVYLQFLDPNMKIIEDNFTTISVSGNTYSKKVEFVYTGEELSICEAINVPIDSLEEGIYTLNVFEDERLLSSTEFQLK